tara:strand:+ start:125 stop:535 length:411 start_codon:yes stop_codon:yes gene_type:complete
MEDKLVFRPLIDSDYETICSWWKWWRWPILPKDFLPNNGKGGFIVEKNSVPIVSCYLYLTNSSVAIFDWVVSNPEYKEKDRKKAIEKLINDTELFCKDINIKHLFSIGRNQHLIKTHEKLGWHIDKKSSYELIKKI